MIGEILQFAGGSAPDGYLLCDGTAVGRAEYPELFAIIGTTYGPGDGSSTFNLPDFSGRVALGSSQSYQFGSTGGASEATLVSSDIPSHSHVVPAHSHEDDIGAETPVLTHNVTSQCSFTYTRLNGTTSERSSTAVNYYSSRTSGAMTRSTDFAVADHPSTACTMSGGVLDCASFDTENSGGGLAHNNMMPYLAVTYLIHAYIPVPVEPGMALYNGCCVVSAGGGYITGKT